MHADARTSNDAPEVLYERHKAHHDRTVRCYLTLACSRACPWCSAGIPGLSAERKAATLPAAVWAEGINRRGREVILCGGEPLLYRELGALLAGISPKIRIQIYSNLEGDIDPLLRASRTFPILASLHTDDDDQQVRWLERATALIAAGNGVRVHIVKKGDWQTRRDLAADLGVKVTCCDDQRGYSKSIGTPRRVNCLQFYYVYGPDGYRYPCVTLMGGGQSRREHISEPDGLDGLVTQCDRFGACCGCDNLVEGRAVAAPESPESTESTDADPDDRL